jgi:hypothetical protein
MQQAMRGFVPEPDCGRGTIGIIWSCIVTVVLCTYSALHRHVADQHSTIWWKIIVDNLIALISPEVMLSWAITDLLEAREVIRTGLRHEISLTICQAHLIVMGGVQIQQGKPDCQRFLTSTREVLDALVIPQIRTSFPSDLEIRERSKGDTLSKLLTAMQLLWFTVQAISRRTQRKTVSILEVATLAFVSMALLSCIIWFKKPQGLSSPFVICGDAPFRSYLEVQERKTTAHVSALAFFSFGAFAGIHLSAWNYAFPSTIEMWLWRISSLLVLYYPALPRFIYKFGKHPRTLFQL